MTVQGNGSPARNTDESWLGDAMERWLDPIERSRRAAVRVHRIRRDTIVSSDDTYGNITSRLDLKTVAEE